MDTIVFFRVYHHWEDPKPYIALKGNPAPDGCKAWIRSLKGTRVPTKITILLIDYPASISFYLILVFFLLLRQKTVSAKAKHPLNYTIKIFCFSPDGTK